MKLIILYGPPATGKFTVAKQLSKLTGYPLFHNHLVANLTSSIFPFGTKSYSDLSINIRLLTIRAALKNKIPGMIMTFAYGVETFGGRDDALLRRMVGVVKSASGTIHFVKCYASEDALKKRIADPSRKKFKKLTSYRSLQKLRIENRMDLSIPFAKSILLDTTKLTPKRAAKLIEKEIKQ